MRRVLLAGAAVLLVACHGDGSGGSPSGVSCDPAPNAAVAWADVDAKLEAALGGDFGVQRGEMHFFRVSDCAGLSNCFGNNPTSPYGFWCLPPAAGAVVADTELAKICPADLRPTWRLREDEAIVAFGRTPPRAKYLGFRSYVYSRVAKSLVREPRRHAQSADDLDDGDAVRAARERMGLRLRVDHDGGSNAG